MIRKKKEDGKQRAWLVPVLLLLLAVLLEGTLFQLSFWRSLAETETGAEALTVQGEYQVSETDGLWHVPEGTLTLQISDIHAPVHTLFLDLALPEGGQAAYTISLVDEGNAYAYDLPERVVMEGVRETYYTKLYAYGDVQELTIRFEAEGELVFRPDGIVLNTRLPFAFQPVRVCVFYLVFLALYALRAESGLHRVSFLASSREGRKKRLTVVLVFAGLLFLGGWGIVRANPFCRGLLAVHQAQYQELAEALTKGRVSVGEAEDIRLLEAPNPYDTIYLQAEQIPYRADYAYYEGSYYVYFGIVPELLCYLPFYLLTGHDLPNYLAVYAFYAGFLAASCGLVWQIMKRWFGGLPFYLYFFMVVLLVGCGHLVYLVVRPDMYNVPVMAANFFTAAGLAFWIRGLEEKRFRKTAYALGALCLALTAGCRPQFLMYGFLAVPLFWKDVWKERTLFSRKGWKETLALVLPVVLVAAGVMAYNGVRFSSPFDFGANYSLTSNDMTHRGFNLERILYGIAYFLFLPPHMEGAFPFLSSAKILTDYMGKMVSESYYGGLVLCNPLLWLLLWLPKFRRQLGQKALTGTVLFAAAASLIICAADANGAGIIQRYSADMAFGLLLAGMLLCLVLAEWTRKKGLYGHFCTWLLAGTGWNLLFAFLLAFSVDGSVNLRDNHPALFYQAAQWFRF